MWKDLKEAAGHGLRFTRRVFPAAVGLYLLSGLYIIRQNQIGVAAVLGKVNPERARPGLHYSLPPPLGRVWKLPAREIKRAVIDDFAPAREGVPHPFTSLTGLESYLLTGDNNAVHIEIVLQYTVADPYLYLAGSSGPDSLLREIVCHEIVQVMASRTVDNALTVGKKEIEDAVRARAQKRLEENRTGLALAAVEIKEVQPPLVVQAFFTDVINAQVEKKGMISQAESYRNEVIPRGRGESERMLKEAESHRDRAVKAAQGESERFAKNLAEFRKAPAIGRRRLYLDFVRETLSRVEDLHFLDVSGGRPPARLRIFPSE